MARKPFTAKFVESQKKTAMRREIPDPGLTGFYFVIQPTGAKSWAVRYRYGGRPRKLTIGPYPAFSLAAARKAASAHLRAASEGRDPGQEKLAQKAAQAEDADTIDKLLDEFLKRHVRPNNRPRYAAEAERICEREIRPAWKKRKIGSITKRDVINLLDKISDRGAPYMANRTFALLRKFGNWAVSRDVVPVSPCAGLKAPTGEVTRDRVLTNDEVKLFWKASEGLGLFTPVFKLLLLTGQRREEVAGISDNELDVDSAEPGWIIPPARAKNGKQHYVPLAPTAIEILRGVDRIKNDARLVFTTTGETSVSGFSRAKKSLDEAMIELAREEALERGEDPAKVSIAPWRLHDLRRTAASGMAALGQPVHVVEAALNHKSGTISGIAAVYNRHEYAEEKRRALCAWASFVTELTTDAPAGNVIAMRAAQ